jgi:hypothetical protein
MAWEKRQRGGLYYYRSRRAGGTVVKEYLGKESRAVRAAAEIAEKRVKREALKQETERARSAASLVANFAGHVDLAVSAVLLNGGWYKHHRGWRRRNVGKAHKDT